MEHRITVLETKVSQLEGQMSCVNTKLDTVNDTVTRIDEHLQNGLGQRIADKIEATRATKSRTHNTIIALIGAALLAVEIVAAHV